METMKISVYKKTIIGIGILVALIPALGFPQDWENPFLIVAGILIIVLPLAEVFIKIETKEEEKKEESEIIEEQPHVEDEEPESI